MLSWEEGVVLASISLHWLGWGSYEHLRFSEETSLEPDLRLLPTEANHFTFISTALQIAFQVGRTVKALLSLGRRTLSPPQRPPAFYNLRGSLCQVLTQLWKADTHSWSLASQTEASPKCSLGLKLESGSATQSGDAEVAFVKSNFLWEIIANSHAVVRKILCIPPMVTSWRTKVHPKYNF